MSALQSPGPQPTTPFAPLREHDPTEVPQLDAALIGAPTVDVERVDTPELVEPVDTPELVEQVDSPELVEVPPTGPTVSLAVATWALFVGLALMLVGAGTFATLVAVRTELDGYRALEIGLVGGGYYAGFLAGTRVALRAVGAVGHIRVFTALASLFASSILAAAYLTTPAAWIALRLLAGACLAGQYVVSESWLNQLVSNERRGRLLSIYTAVTVIATGTGQFLFSRFDPTATTGFAVAALLVSLAVVPVAMSVNASPPTLSIPEKMSLRQLWAIVPTGVVTSTLVGIAHGSFLGLAAVYATRSGLSVTEVGLFVALPAVGGLIFSVPITGASDRRDRRLVGAAASTAAGAAALLLALVGPEGPLGALAMVAIGGMTFPLYSIAGAYTNDSVPVARLTSAAAQLVLLYGAGAFAGPLLGAVVMSVVGVDGYAWTVVIAHVAIASFLIFRVLQYPTAMRAKPERAVALGAKLLVIPPTINSIGHRMRPLRRLPEADTRRRLPPPVIRRRRRSDPH